MYKITLLLAVTIFTATITNAQISKDNLILGGNLSLNLNSQKNEGSESTNTTNFSIAPSIGKVYKDNHVIGLIAKYKFSGVSNNSNLNTNSFGAGVYLRQYKPLDKGFYIFAQESLNADFDHARSIHNEPGVIEDDKVTNIYLALNPGFSYDINRRLQAELLFLNNFLSLGYQTQNTKFENTNLYTNYKNNTFYASSTSDFGLWNSVSLGVKIFLNR